MLVLTLNIERSRVLISLHIIYTKLKTFEFMLGAELHHFSLQNPRNSQKPSIGFSITGLTMWHLLFQAQKLYTSLGHQNSCAL